MKTIKFPAHHDDATIRAFAAACEADFAKRLGSLVDRIAANPSKLIALSGPSCAGKTTTALRLIDRLSKEGLRVQVVSLDDFYRTRDELMKEAEERGGVIDFDSPATLDWPILEAFIDAVLDGRTAYLPKFDFQSGERLEAKPLPADSYDCLLFEGIQAFYRRFLDLLPAGSYTGVFITPESGLKVGEAHLLPVDIRLCRRMVRDSLFRGATPEFTMSLWKSVVENEDLYIFPGVPMAHYRLDTSIGYELCLMRDAVLKALASLPRQYRNEQTAHIAAVVEKLPSLPREVMPEDSMLREFLG